MKLQLESTDKVVMLQTSKGDVPARIWEGESEAGVPVIAFITRVAVATKQGPEDFAVFERELIECRAPSEAAASFPDRLIL
jgi:hypothetical protein